MEEGMFDDGASMEEIASQFELSSRNPLHRAEGTGVADGTGADPPTAKQLLTETLCRSLKSPLPADFEPAAIQRCIQH
jgi:hypothetical protein